MTKNTRNSFTIGGALTVVILFLADQLHIDMDEGVAAAIAFLVTAGVGGITDAIEARK